MKKRRITAILLCAAVMILGGCNNNTEVKEESTAGSQTVSEREISLTASDEESSEVESRETERSEEERIETEISQTAESSAEEKTEREPDKTAESSSEESEEGLTSEELEQMWEAETYVQDFINSKKFQEASVDKRRSMSVEFLNTLAEKGLIIKESIYASDDMVSYSFSCGALGGISIKEWDPMMNGIDGEENSLISSNKENSLPDGALIEPQVNVQDKSDFKPTLLSFRKSDLKLIGVKNFSEFEKLAKPSGEKTHIFTDLFSETFKKDNICYEILIFAGEKGDNELNGFDYLTQKKGDSSYQAVNVIINGKLSKYGQKYITKGDKIYSLEEDEKKCIVCDKSESNFSMVGEEFEDMSVFSGDIKQCGNIMIDGKNMYYELYSNDDTYIVAYFDGEKFYKAEVYQLTEFVETSPDSSVKEGISKIVGFIYAAYTDDIRPELFEIPSGYEIIEYQESSDRAENSLIFD